MSLYNSMKIYGLFDQYLLLELCRNMKRTNYNTGDFIFKAGKVFIVWKFK